MMGYAGLISFGHAAYFGLGAYTSAIILTQTGVPLPFAIICGAFVSGIVAGPIAYICTRSTGIYFSMLTLATSQLLYTIAYKWHSLTGGSDGITGVPRTALWPDGPSFAGPIPFYYLVAAIFIACLIASMLLMRSPFGRALQAIRENERRFRSLGQDPNRFKIAIFVIAASLAGIAGATFAPFRGYASPEAMFWVLSGQIIMMNIIGGVGTLIGPLVGAVIFIMCQEILSSYTEHWMILMGGIFILMVIWLPGGLVGFMRTRFASIFVGPL